MADETMFARLCNAAHYARHPALRQPPGIEAAQRDETITIVRALLTELRHLPMETAQQAARHPSLADTAHFAAIPNHWSVIQEHFDVAIDAILAEAGGSGGA